MSEAKLESSTCSIFDLAGCPHCGGTSGFNYILTIKGTQFQPWRGGNGEPNFEHDKSTKHGAYRCDDCGKIIKLNNEVRDASPRTTPGAKLAFLATNWLSL